MTKRKTSSARKTNKPRQAASPDPGEAAFMIPEFCIRATYLTESYPRFCRPVLSVKISPVLSTRDLTTTLKRVSIRMLPLQRADVAQSVERILGKDEVTSSNLVISSTKTCRNAGFFVSFWPNSASFAYELFILMTSSFKKHVFVSFFVSFFDSERPVRPYSIRFHEGCPSSVFSSDSAAWGAIDSLDCSTRSLGCRTTLSIIF